MAQTESLSVFNLDSASKKMEVKDNQPGKKFKQARLPFMPIDHEQKSFKTTTPPGSKKRKLSGNDTPSPKQAKVSAKPVKPPSPDGDAEVSSSSEAEPGTILGHHKGAKKYSTLDRFLYKKREEHHEEISSTNDCVPMAIDLTDDTESDHVDSANDKCDNSSAADKETIKEIKEDTVSANEPVADEKDNNKFTEIKTIKETETEIENSLQKVNDTQCKENKNEPEATAIDIDDKENVKQEVESVEDEEVDQSFVSDTSVCEAALKTPAKDRPLESVLKTPIVAAKKDAVSSPAAQSPGTSTDVTPKSAKIKSRSISASKLKEKEAQRLQREKEKEEKRLQKEKEKEEKEKEKLEKKRQKDEEKAEKERQKQEEKDKKEKERLEKLQQKEEEKKKKEELMQAKMEEKKKKDEERKQKEEEKKMKEEEKQKEEEEKLKKKVKRAQSFKSFFIEKTPTVSPPKVKEGKNQFFMPFEMKLNMRLAPTRRVDSFSTDGKENLDQCMLKQECNNLYLTQLKSGSVTKRKSKKTYPRQFNEEKDIEILCHDEETIKKTLHKVKFLKFTENNRPPYYGTWTKPTTILSARNPFKQDEALFDYEVDSDDEWEEEDPGESVSSDEEDDDKDSKDKDEEEEDADGWMVPHGYLSDDEGIENEDDMDLTKKKQLQAARQEAWEREIKMQTQPLKMISIGCVWEGETTAIAARQLEKLLSYKAVCLRTDPIPTSFARCEVGDTSHSQSDKNDRSATQTPRQGLKKSVPQEAMPDLIRLVHGNPTGLKNLIREFRTYWQKKVAPESLKKLQPSADTSQSETEDQNVSQGDNSEAQVNAPNDASMEVDDNTDTPNTPPRDKTETDNIDSQIDFVLSLRQLEKKIISIGEREKKAKAPQFLVFEKVLKQYGLEDIQLPNSWEYVLIKPPLWATRGTPKPEDSGANKSASTSGRATPTVPSITQFAQAMSPAQIQAQNAVASPISSKLNLKAAEQETAELTAESQEEEKPVPKDQFSIKNFFKLATSSPKQAVGKLVNGSSNDAAKTERTDIPANEIKSKECMKPGEKVSDTNTCVMKPGQGTPQNDVVNVKPIKRNYSVLAAQLSEPAGKLLKVTSVSAGKTADLTAVNGETENKAPAVEPMETDVIVLD